MPRAIFALYATPHQYGGYAVLRVSVYEDVDEPAPDAAYFRATPQAQAVTRSPLYDTSRLLMFMSAYVII